MTLRPAMDGLPVRKVTVRFFGLDPTRPISIDFQLRKFWDQPTIAMIREDQIGIKAAQVRL